MASIAIFISFASIFLPRYSGVRPTIRPATKTVRIDEQQHAVEAGADAAGDDLAELHVEQRDHAAERGERVVHGVDGAAGGRGGDDRKQRRGDDAEADLLAFHVAAGEAERVQRGRAGGFRPVADGTRRR